MTEALISNGGSSLAYVQQSVDERIVAGVTHREPVRAEPYDIDVPVPAGKRQIAWLAPYLGKATVGCGAEEDIDVAINERQFPIHLTNTVGW